MLEVLKLFLASRNAAIKEVHFPAELGPSFVYATPDAIEEAVNLFLGIEASGGPRGSLEDGEAEGEEEEAAKEKKGKARRSRSKKKPHIAKPKPPGSDGLVPAREAGELEAKTSPRRVGGGFPVFYPTRLPSGASFVESNPYEHVSDPRVYHLKDKDKRAPRAPTGWSRRGRTAGRQPLLRGAGDPRLGRPADPRRPDRTKTINGREYDIYADGGRIKMVAWHRGENTYWISNDLLQTFTNDQMVGIARSADVIVPKRRKPRQRGKNE